MPNLALINTTASPPVCRYKEQAGACTDKATMSGFATDVAAPPWRFGARVDLLEVALTRHGQRSEAPYANLCATMARLVNEPQYRGLTVLAVSPYAIQARGYKQAYRVESGGREVASIACQPKRPFPNTPGVLFRIHCDLLNRLGLEDDFERLVNLILSAGYQPFITRIRRLELAYDVPARLTDHVRWVSGNSKKTSFKTTNYLGNHRSFTRLRCYDKAAQLRTRHRINPQGDILRIEICLQRVPLIGWRDTLSKRRNILKSLQFIRKDTLAHAFPPSTSPGLWNAAHSGNLTPAIQGMSKSGQKKVKQRLKALPAPEWYCPDEMWEALLQAAERCPWLP